jgi:hypothetical protein
MRSLLFSNWWSALNIEQQIFWSLAIVFSILSCILVLLDLFGFDQEQEQPANQNKSIRVLDARTGLILFTSFGWFGVLFSAFNYEWQQSLLFAASGALVLSFLQGLIFGFPWNKELDIKRLVESTGQVQKTIPPHRNGVGKVHLDVRKKTYELDALTTGQELPEGAPVRVVDIVDERVLVVEPLELKPKGPQ